MAFPHPVVSTIDRASICSCRYAQALQHEVLRCAIRTVAGEFAAITLTHLEEASEMLTNRRTEGQKLFFGRLRIQEEYDIISITFLQ